MEQITLIFLIGTFILFLIQFKWKDYPLKIMGFFASVSTVVLSLRDTELSATPELLAVMLVTGFAFTLFNVVGMLKTKG